MKQFFVVLGAKIDGFMNRIDCFLKMYKTEQADMNAQDAVADNWIYH